MSLLTRPRHVIVVHDGAEHIDRYGRATSRRIPDREPRQVACNVHPLSVEETIRYGVSTAVARKVVSRTWPVGPHDDLTLGGHRWEVVSAEHYDMSAATDHWEIVIRRQEAT